MRVRSFVFFIFIIIISIFLSGCIHEYPHPVKGNSSDKGENPTAINAEIQVSFNLSWENILHNVEISTKSGVRDERPHRFVIEVIKEGEQVCHDLDYLTAEEFSLGSLTHKISVPLEASSYQIAVWYDFQDDEGHYSFDADNLTNVSLLNLSTDSGENLQCAYATDTLDLSHYSNSQEEIHFTKELHLSHAGARFEIVTTDIQKFIETYKASLNQGDSFTVNLTFTGDTPSSCNLYKNNFNYGEITKLSGKMRLPFAEYEELKIAEGFVFCPDEGEVTMKLNVINSSLIPVCETEYFSFPVKRGCITIVRGDFLSSPVDGIFSVNTIWDEEIIIEI